TLPPSRRSSCQISRGSVPLTTSQACRASRSSQLPGNWRTPQIIGRHLLRFASGDAWPVRDSSRSKGLDLVVLDQGIGEELLAELAELVQVIGLQLDHPPDVDVPDALEAEGRQRPLDRLALRIEDPLL